MTTGRLPKPTKLKLLQGNPGKRALPAEPVPPAGEVRPPAWLRGRGRRAWKWFAPTLAQMGLLTTADPHALALLCDAYAEYQEARAIVEAQGMTYTNVTQTGETVIRARPEVAIAAHAWRRTALMLTHFGMTPSARTRVKAAPEADRDSFGEFMSNGG